ncbi:helix-turn-helix domain-containing protein [Lactobacillus sp. B4005]|uniref:helix-turn-helix domain-containing protein n=1 Tax=Lactobacillus sp. B4005 TaxID=2818031 RepID=UPI00226A5B78|nr:helix-turn-helix domain-containing protein [Lactobacillus sp. B4005]MCX8724425.1 helix-turn-helix domain-containing protein [Lactobacillus sp. B4005]
MKQELKLLSQREIAERLGVSKGTLSKWLSKNNVSEETRKGNKKLYQETIIQQYQNAHKSNNEATYNGFSTIDFLQKELQRKQAEIDELKQDGKQKDATIADLANKLAKLADQAQQLNLTDKDNNKLQRLTNDPYQKQDKSINSPAEPTPHHWWQKLFQ